MNIHLTTWWLWWALIALYAVVVVVGMFLTMIADEAPRWWVRPSILVWPLTAATLGLWHAGRFLIGKE